ncbi:family transcriptional regulator [Micractinium conductrix]|uniref:Family transcriptional regulator n=1 Tax=Micractinium conductrix TaxID=554055 RepID=A0A2P6V678_9CHLO|nr:family transcriptional regulator [Micractinium conductrix]|eukprot:PSC69597.1 family transcriptional regulator [Micractinium conductrix]
MLLRPLAGTRGHAYHYAEDSARAALRDEERGSGPDLTSMYAPVEEVGDNITAPKGWHFSNRIDQLEEKQQERVAAQVDRAREAGGPPAEK